MSCYNKVYHVVFAACGIFFSHLNFAQSDVTITVWVHGTYPVMNALIAKHSPFRSWVYTEPGISLAKKLPYDYYFRKLAYECHAHNSTGFCVDHFYTYGWYSSKMRPGHRREEGEHLYKALMVLLKEYKEKYETITLRLVGMSHGGNVILNCVHHMPFKFEGVEVELVLLATPIQESTREFVNNPCVHRTYSFYSDADWMQRIDAQKFHHDAPQKVPFWSNRKFKETDRVIQIRLKINGQFIGHGKYRSVAHHLPAMLKLVDDYVGLDQQKAHVMLDFEIK